MHIVYGCGLIRGDIKPYRSKALPIYASETGYVSRTTAYLAIDRISNAIVDGLHCAGFIVSDFATTELQLFWFIVESTVDSTMNQNKRVCVVQ